MKELVEYIAKSLVDDPSQVKVTEIEGNTSIIFELSVSPEETGRVIGLRTGEQRGQIGIGRLVTGGAVDAVERIQVNNLHAQRRKGPFVFRAARFDHVAQIAPALVVTAREGGYVGIIRDARAQVEHGDRFSGFALLADQTAAGIQRVIQVGREVNPMHAPIILVAQACLHDKNYVQAFSTGPGSRYLSRLAVGDIIYPSLKLAVCPHLDGWPVDPPGPGSLPVLEYKPVP